MTVRTFGINGKTDTASDYRLIAGGLLVSASALNGRSGVLTVPTITGTGSLTCTLNPFSCFIDGTSNAQQGGYLVTLDAGATITFTTGSAQSRIDLIGIQIQDNDYDGSGQHQGIPVYVAGTPGSGVAPATPANTIALFTVPVAALATSVVFTSATAVHPFTAASGGIVPVRNASDKPAVVNGVQFRYRLDVTPAAGSTSPLESSTDGLNWHPVFDASVVPAAVTAAIGGSYGAWTNAVVNTPLFTVGVQPQYRTIPGNRIELRGWVSSPGAGTVPSGSPVIGSLPVPSSERMPNAAIEDSSGNTALLLLGPSAGANTNTCYTFSSGSLSNCSIGFDGVTYSL